MYFNFLNLITFVGLIHFLPLQNDNTASKSKIFNQKSIFMEKIDMCDFFT